MMEAAHASFGALSGGDVAAQPLALTVRGRAKRLHERLNYRVSCSVAILLPALFNAFRLTAIAEQRPMRIEDGGE